MVKTIDITKREIGVSFSPDGASVLLWAPQAEKVYLIITSVLGDKIEMNKQDFGYWLLLTDRLKEGDEYQFELLTNGELLRRPDPASLLQPQGVHGVSKAVNTGLFFHQPDQWVGPALKEYIIYELHVGTFSSKGTFDGVIDHLDHLLDLGITAIELMPVAAFPGERNWGYDGVLPFAVQESYGGPAGLAQLVAACHQKGLAVILDVVYNHFGPEGNYLEDFGPYLTAKYETPWGKAVNYDDAGADGIRHYMIENALMWLRDFKIDALRLDAVHAIRDFSATHILEEMSIQVDKLNQATGKNHQLIIEFDLNDPRYISSRGSGGLGMDTQWNDEFHHALRVAAGQTRTGYYADFNGLADLARAYTGAYVYQGQYSPHRGRSFGRSADGQPGTGFVVFCQNHDQVGNRMLGERSSQLLGLEMQKLLFGAVMVAPFLPLLFMGEEWAASTPFQYFVSHGEEELIAAVRKGRATEFKDFHEGEPPDPQDKETFERSKLKWEELAEKQHAGVLRFYKAMIALRKTDPILNALNRERLLVEVDGEMNCLSLQRWDEDTRLLCLMNFSATAAEVPVPEEKNEWEVAISSAAKDFGGSGTPQIQGQKVILPAQSILILRTHYV